MNARKVFALFGTIAIQGMEAVNKQMSSMDKETRKLTRTIDRLGKNVAKVGAEMTKTLTAPIAAASGAMLLLNTRTAQMADRLLDLRQVTGLSTDNLQGLQNVARHAGVNFEGLTKTVQTLTSRMPQLINEGGKATGAFRALGYSTEEVLEKSKDMDAFFPELIHKLQGVENATDRNIMAQAIFGAELKDLAPVLGMTSAEFDRLMGDAQNLAGFMDGDALAAADEYRKAFEQLKAQFEGLWTELSLKLIPIFKDVLFPLLSETVIPAIASLTDMVGGVADWFMQLNKPIQETVMILVAMAAAIGPTVLIMGKLISAAKIMAPLYMALVKGQLSLNAAMAANPLGFIITLIAGLVAAAVALYKNWDTVSAFFIRTWEDIRYHTTQAANFVIQKFLELVRLYVTGIGLIVKHIPGLNRVYDAAKQKLDEMIESQKSSREERKLEREETLLQRKAAEEFVEVLDEAKQATTEYNLAEMNLRKSKEETTDATKDQHKAEAELARRREAFEENYADRFRRETYSRLALLEFEHNKALELAEELGADLTMVEEYYSLKRRQIAHEEAQYKIDEERRAATLRARQQEQFTNTMIGSMFRGFDVFSDINSNKSERINQDMQEQIAAINAMELAEEEKLEKIAEAEAEAAAKKRDLARRQAKSEKASGVFAVGIATVQAAMRAFAELGPIFGPIAAGVVSAIGTAKAAAIAAKPLPMKTGGLVRGGRGGIVAEVGEADQDELVLPMRTGVDALVDSLLSKVGSLLPAAPRAASAAYAGAAGHTSETHWHIGTLVADDRSIKELERRMATVRVSESQRKGGA